MPGVVQDYVNEKNRSLSVNRVWDEAVYGQQKQIVQVRAEGYHETIARLEYSATKSPVNTLLELQAQARSERKEMDTHAERHVQISWGDDSKNVGVTPNAYLRGASMAIQDHYWERKRNLELGNSDPKRQTGFEAQYERRDQNFERSVLHRLDRLEQLHPPNYSSGVAMDLTTARDECGPIFQSSTRSLDLSKVLKTTDDKTVVSYQPQAAGSEALYTVTIDSTSLIHGKAGGRDVPYRGAS